MVVLWWCCGGVCWCCSFVSMTLLLLLLLLLLLWTVYVVGTWMFTKTFAPLLTVPPHCTTGAQSAST